MQALTFWMPELLNSLRVEEAQSALKEMSLPALQTLLSKADIFPARQTSFYETASYLFHQPETLPVAAILGKQLLHAFDESQFWIKVDPVQMIADRDSLVLVAGKHLAISEDESKQLIKAFNEHFQEDGVYLHWGNANNWFLAIKQPIDIQTTALDRVDHQPINAFLPTGNAAQYWRQLINETQMLFFNHPVNEQRREQGYPEINSVWIWGEGQLAHGEIQLRQEAVICSANTYLQGLAQVTQAVGVDEDLPSYKAFMQQVVNKNINNAEKCSYIIMLDSLFNELDSLTMEQWQARLLELESNWFSPLLRGLKQKQVNSLLIDVGSNRRYHLKPAHLKRFWRFKKALTQV